MDEHQLMTTYVLVAFPLVQLMTMWPKFMQQSSKIAGGQSIMFVTLLVYRTELANTFCLATLACDRLLPS